jgi:hypothetical protein
MLAAFDEGLSLPSSARQDSQDNVKGAGEAGMGVQEVFLFKEAQGDKSDYNWCEASLSKHTIPFAGFFEFWTTVPTSARSVRQESSPLSYLESGCYSPIAKESEIHDRLEVHYSNP